jgi:hypothetical protein
MHHPCKWDFSVASITFTASRVPGYRSTKTFQSGQKIKSGNKTKALINPEISKSLEVAIATLRRHHHIKAGLQEYCGF